MPIFVIQKHDATRLHYDFRLEVGGTLRSWAVPKGPSTNPRQKRLAVEVEDHSIGWGDFEGRISEGYGKGEVIVWDRGTYVNRTERDDRPMPIAKALERGHARFELRGEKLKGEFTLTRIPKGNWLLTKIDDEHADANDDILERRPESVVSGKTIEDLKRPVRKGKAA
jgi:DNA ligase D-like protein (predicted 3'-phosphoesterase)